MRFLNSFAPPTPAARALSSPGEWEPRWDSAVCWGGSFPCCRRGVEAGRRNPRDGREALVLLAEVPAERGANINRAHQCLKCKEHPGSVGSQQGRCVSVPPSRRREVRAGQRVAAAKMRFLERAPFVATCADGALSNHTPSVLRWQGSEGFRWVWEDFLHKRRSPPFSSPALAAGGAALTCSLGGERSPTAGEKSEICLVPLRVRLPRGCQRWPHAAALRG